MYVKRGGNIMAKRKRRSTNVSSNTGMPCSPAWCKPCWFLFGVFVVILGVLLWRGYSLERVLSVLLVVSGLKMVLLSFWKG